MKSVIRFLFFDLLLSLTLGQSYAQDLPEFRPALLGQGRRSLVNLIDVESLYKRGQRDAIIMFRLRCDTAWRWLLNAGLSL